MADARTTATEVYQLNEWVSARHLPGPSGAHDPIPRVPGTGGEGGAPHGPFAMIASDTRWKAEEVFQLNEYVLGIRWADGHESLYSARDLRIACHCAWCREEGTGKRRLDPQTVPEDVRIVAHELTGNYAVRMVFSDGHKTGIYPFKKLRELCPCSACAGAGEGARHV